MATTWILSWGEVGSTQTEDQLSFVGGKPVLPEDVVIPVCELCGSTQTFFFQVAFPEPHDWSDMSMSVFSCTSCADEDHLIPEMLDGSLYGADIPENFLSGYQTNFRFVVFSTSSGVIREGYEEKVCYRPIVLRCTSDSDVVESKIGGSPVWLLEDESPGSYVGKYEMTFLLQLEAGLTFEIVDSAPPQTELGLTGSPEASPNRWYQLFNGNALYLFGVRDRELPLVYAITQI